MSIVESNIEAVWGGKQSAQGTLLADTATGLHRFRKVAGDFSTNRDDGSEAFSDLTVYGDQADFVNNLTGEGDPGLEAQPEQIDSLIYWFSGVTPTTTGAADPFVHVTQPPTPPAVQSDIWTTWFKRVGAGSIVRQRFGDCLVAALTIEGSTANKIVRVTPQLLSLQPGLNYASDPTVAIDSTPPFVYTEGASRFKLALTQATASTVAVRSQSQFRIVITRNMTPYYGDDVTPYAIVPGKPELTIACTVLMDDVALPQYNRLIYNNPTPADGDAPARSIPPLGAFSIDLQRPGAGVVMTGAGSKGLKLEFDGIKWEPGIAIPGNPDGGPIEVPLTGSGRRRASSPLWKATITNGHNNAAVIA